MKFRTTCCYKNWKCNKKKNGYNRGNAVEPSISISDESDVVAASAGEMEQLSIIS